MNLSLNTNFYEFNSFPVFFSSNKYGTKTFQPKTEEEYKLYLREIDENHRKTGIALGIIVYSTIIFSCISVYTIYSLIIK